MTSELIIVIHGSENDFNLSTSLGCTCDAARIVVFVVEHLKEDFSEYNGDNTPVVLMLKIMQNCIRCGERKLR